jgi:hypothetical protein
MFITNNFTISVDNLLRHSVVVGIATVSFFLMAACSSIIQKPAFDPKRCIETIPARVKGLQILSGPRSEKNIIRDMVPVVCNGHMLFKRMNTEGNQVNAGRVVFKVLVEYTGEVNRVKVEETTIKSDMFLKRLSNIIMDTDFTFWGKDSNDTEFLYPIHFGS